MKVFLTRIHRTRMAKDRSGVALAGFSITSHIWKKTESLLVGERREIQTGSLRQIDTRGVRTAQ